MTKSPTTDSLVIGNLHLDLPISSDATTSRTAVSNDAARVVAFSLDAGQELTVGDVVYLAPSERHAVVALTPCRFSLVLVTTAP